MKKVIRITEEMLEQIVKRVIDEKAKKKKKKDTTLCKRGITAAKAKYDVYPSAYANGYAVQVCKGTQPDANGNKRCSGKYCPGKK
jgi:CRISPR/Cas system-associated protein Cas7 (RAMP superfamily)